MALTVLNQDFSISGGAELFVFAYTPVAGANLAAKIKAMYELLYTDGDIRKGTPKVSQWANLDGEAGLTCKFKSLNLERTPMSGNKELIGYSGFDANIECTLFDADVAHMKDIVSASSGQIFTTTAAAGKAARTTLAFGSQQRPNKYAIIIRSISGNGITGEFDHWVFPRVTFDIDADLKFDKKDSLRSKLGINPMYDQNLIDPDTGKPILALVDTVTGAGL